MIKRFINKIKEKKFAKSQTHKLYKKGSLMNAFYKSKTIFIHIPKIAGTSLVKAIYGNMSKEGHRKISFYQEILGREIEEYFTFCFVRNPYDRLYSSFKFLENGGMNIHDRNAFEIYLSSYKDFEDFVINGLDKEIINKITHFIPQTDFICSRKGKVLVDFVGRYEDLISDVNILSDKLRKEITLTPLNVNKNKESYQKVYTNVMKNIVKEIYKNDFDILDY